MDTPYVELHCHSYHSLLDGASSSEELVERAVDLGYPALALCDHDGLYGVVRFWRAAKERGIKPIIGAEVSLVDDSHLTLLAETQTGYASLCRLISAAQLAGHKGDPQLTVEMIAQHASGLLCLSGCRRGRVASALLGKDEVGALRAAVQFKEIFGDRFWIEVQRHHLCADSRLVPALLKVARDLDVGVVATNNVHYAGRTDQRLHDILACIRHRVTLPEALAAGLLHPNSEQYLKSPQEMALLFADLPELLHNTVRIAERCNVQLDFAAQRLPAFPVPEGHTLGSYLAALCEAALEREFLIPDQRQARAQLDHELAVIECVGLAGYFLIVWDIVQFARRQGIRCQGRGSAANSLVAFLLGITRVNPLEHNLLFERFLSEGTHTMPDIDIDFAADRREQVIQYVYDRYGEKHVGMVCNVVTYRARSALRDVAKTLVFPPDVIDRVAKALDTRSTEVAADKIERELVPQTAERRELDWGMLVDVLRQMEGVPRHLSIHVGGMLITASPLVEIVPLERATMPDRVVVQWDKDSVEDAGLIKIDLLSLCTLGMIEEALDHIRASGMDVPDLDHLPLDEPAIYAMLQRADTIGCFQVESRAQIQMLPRLRPICFEDLVIEVALVRPGPIQGNMVHPYLQRRHRAEPVSYLHPALEPILSETLGVMIFQEQVIRVAVAIAGFTPAEADQLRRAMSRSRSKEAMQALRSRFLEKARAQGVDGETAEAVYKQLEAFSGYGFCKSHAAAFAQVAYQTLYLKSYFAVPFYCALLNHQPMGFYAPEVLIGDAKRHGVPILRPDVNRSQGMCTLENANSTWCVRLGLCYVHGLGEINQERIVARRGQGEFRDLWDFCTRTCLPRSLVQNLIRAGVMDGFGKTRRDLLWALGDMVYHEEGLNLQVPTIAINLPELSRLERMLWEYELLGLAPDHHLMSIYRERLRAKGFSSSQELHRERSGRPVRVAGLVVVRQRPPSAKRYVFATLEDEDGLINLIVRPKIYERYKRRLHGASVLAAEGQLQRAGQATNILVDRLIRFVD